MSGEGCLPGAQNCCPVPCASGDSFFDIFFLAEVKEPSVAASGNYLCLVPRLADNTSLAAALKALCWLIVRRQTGCLGRWLKLYRIRYEAGPEVSDRYLAQHLRDLAAFAEDLDSIRSLFKI